MVSRFVTGCDQPDQPTAMGLVGRKAASQRALTNLTNLTNPVTYARGRARAHTYARAHVYRSVTLGGLVKAYPSKGFRPTNLLAEVGQVGRR